jgi:hypothetical protein
MRDPGTGGTCTALTWPDAISRWPGSTRVRATCRGATGCCDAARRICADDHLERRCPSRQSSCHVRLIPGEYDGLGQEAFLARHGFGKATAYLLTHNGRSYDPRAISGVAYSLAAGRTIGPHAFGRGIHGAATVIRNLGFEVRNVRAGHDNAQQAQPPGPCRR